jgi:formylglycine-generating enzyme required for sulfatase activity
MKFVVIPPGEFIMGSPKDEPGRRDDEALHKVTLTKPFQMGMHEVTQEQYEHVMGNNPSYSTGANKPVEKVSWNDAVEFCRKLSEHEGVTYRLPTEAEWEYACRAGTTTDYSFGDDKSELGEYAWYYANSGGSTHPVGELKPNAWGVYDMHGNVWEWCQDWLAAYGSENVVIDPTGPASGEHRVLRGGAFTNQPRFVRAAYRNTFLPDNRLNKYGFRLARTYDLSP